MSESTASIHSGNRRQARPSPVRCATWLLLVGALLPLVSVLEVVLHGSPNASFASSSAIGIGIPIVLALLVRRGYGGARKAIWTWSTALAVEACVVVTAGPRGTAEVLSTVFDLSFIVGASVLLALPSSNEYFR
jgi:hypothetical protein